MDINIPSAAPSIINLGIDDQSTVTIPRIPQSIPKHCPKVFSLTESGPEEETLCTAADLIRLYGITSFDNRSIYTTHQSPLITALVKAANMFVMKRITPPDATHAFVTLYMDVLASATVPNYLRDAYGNIVHNNVGNPVLASATGYTNTAGVVLTGLTPQGSATVAGYTVKFTYDSVPFSVNSITHPVNLPSHVTGDQVGGSERYPIATFIHSFKGKKGNHTALRISAPTTVTGAVLPSVTMDTEKVYPYNFAVLTRPDANTGYTPSATLTGGKQVQGFLKENIYDKVTDYPLYIGENFLPNYRLTDDPSYAKVYGELSQVTFYQKNIALLSEMFMTSEIAAGTVYGCDFTTATAVAATDKFLFNIFGLTTSGGQPYKSVIFVDSNNSVRLSTVTQIPLGGGSDGTILDAAGTYYTSFDKQVGAYMANYADPENVLQDLARNVESEVYDTGFSLNTKKELAKIMLIRKNTIVHESTFIEPLSEEPSLVSSVLTAQVSTEEADPLQYHLGTAMVLRAYLALMPESEYFSTSVARATIHPGSYLLRNSKYKRRISPIIDYAYKRAKYMGAANGQWKSGNNYDGAPGSIIELGYDIWPNFVPKSQVFNAWALGLVFAAQYDLSSFHFPVNKTVYENDTSILNSDMVISAIAAINTTVAAVDRMFKGLEGIDPGLLSKKYNDEITARLKGCFDSKYRITPMAQFTSMDSNRGFSITVPVKIEGSVPNSVMVTYVIASRYTAPV